MYFISQLMDELFLIDVYENTPFLFSHQDERFRVVVIVWVS